MLYLLVLVYNAFYQICIYSFSYTTKGNCVTFKELSSHFQVFTIVKASIDTQVTVLITI